MRTRWLFADQLGPHFLDDPGQRVLLIESKAVFRRRVFHRQKAHLVLSALRHRAQDAGVDLVRAETYAEGIRQPLTVCHPTSRAARGLVRRMPDVEMLPPRGFVTSPQEFTAWAHGRDHLRLEDFYRNARQRHGVLMDGGEPAGGRWNLDADNRQPPPRGARQLDAPAPPAITEDEIDQEVRAELDRWQHDDGIVFVGNDGPRLFPVTRAEALARLRHFVEHRLPLFGPYEDAMLAGDPWMAHSMLSPAINLGLLDPMEVIEEAHQDLPTWFAELNADAVEARCLSDVLAGVRDRGWVHHIPRLMVLGNYAMQRGWRPGAVADWFHRCFVDGYEWVMTANVVGMSQYADGGRMSSKPYAAGGAYLNRMSDYCGGCRYDPKVRAGADACPYTAGYWSFLARHEQELAGNHRMAQPLRGLRRLSDLEALLEQEQARGSRAP
jgi:deoxyribodipyrimidine photolyase-related protein